LMTKYGAITAKRVYKKYPALIDIALLSHDSEVRKFAADFIELNAS
jgi:hypothetical protein